MPIAKRAVSTVLLPPRHAKVMAETDVLVVGGGPAGIGSAMGAAQTGAKVLLVEQYGFLGGCATAGLVLTMASYYTSSNQPLTQPKALTLFPLDHGEGTPIIGGVLSELVERLILANGAVAPSPSTGFMVPFDPEIFKQVTLRMLEEAGVELLFYAFASDALCDNTTIQGVIFETKSGPVVAKAKVIIDCTGDGDVAAYAGAPYEMGRNPDQRVQPMSLMFLLNGFNFEPFNRYVMEHPDQWRGVRGLEALMQKAKNQGELEIPRENILLFGGAHNSEVLVNSTRILNTSGTDVWDLTHATLEGHRQITELTRFLRRYVPGFEQTYVQQSGAIVGTRETRRIIGEYQLTTKDVLQAQKFSDGIALGSYPIDIHNPHGKGTTVKKIKAGQAYEIPLRCLIPKKPENLIVAGRCISGTHGASASYRTIPICIATGHAAGVCAAIAAKNNQTPRTVKATEVQKELLKQKAYLDNKT
jgi:ribulose 1,5-bisphosphate synthetase/thiazole synthase